MKILFKVMRNKRLPTPFFVCVVWVVGCASQGLQLPGSWLSTGVTHPSSFFAETLADDKHKSIALFFDQDGGFVWHDRDGVCHLGQYRVQDGILVLNKSQGEPLTLGYTFREDRLRLKSPDGFMFEFRRASEGAHASGRPCDR